jgi:hypothetical protein
MEIQARVWTAQDHYQEILVMNQQSVGAERRFKVILVFVNPLLEMVCGKKLHRTPTELYVFDYQI